MDMDIKIRLLDVMLYESNNEIERAKSENRCAEFHNGYSSALSNVLAIMISDEFAQVMIDYYTGKGE